MNRILAGLAFWALVPMAACQATDLSPLMPPPMDQYWPQMPSCGSSTFGYALKTYYVGLDRGWSVLAPNHQFAPNYLHNQVTYLTGRGNNEGERSCWIMANRGVCTLADQPYTTDQTTWPTAAQCEAGLNYRNDLIGDLPYGSIEGYDPVLRKPNLPAIRTALDQGKVLAMYFKYYDGFESLGEATNYVYYSGHQQGWIVYHWIAIVGYDDTRTDGAGHVGALKVQNSFGLGWADHGYGWIAYDALNYASMPVHYTQGKFYFLKNKPATYVPSIRARISVDHLMNKGNRITIGVGDTSSPTWQHTYYDFEPDFFYVGPDPAHFNLSTVVDVTDAGPYWPPTSQQPWWVKVEDPFADTLSGAIVEFSVTKDGATIGTKTPLPKSIPDLGTAYAFIIGNEAPSFESLPSAVPNPATVGQMVAFMAEATDPENDPLTYTWNFGDGTPAIGAGVTHSYAAAGTYQALAIVTDGNGGMAEKTVTVIVVADNSPPTADARSVTTAEDTVAAIMLSGTDPDGDALTFVVRTQPAHGTLWGTPPNITYTPNSNFNGSDGFTFLVTDGHLDSDPATVAIAVNAVNDAPVAYAQSIETDEDQAKSMALLGFDVDGDALSYEILSGPSNGTLSGSGSNRTYLPSPDFNGTDQFSFRVHDGLAYSAATPIAINVKPINDPPVAIAIANPNAGTAPQLVNFDGTGSYDKDNGIVSYAWNFGDGSTATGTSASHTYTAAGSFQASLTVTDESGAKNTHTFPIVIQQDASATILAYDNLREQSGYNYSYCLGTRFKTLVPITLKEIIIDGLLYGSSDNVAIWKEGSTTPLSVFSVTTGSTTQAVSVAVSVLLEPGTYRMAGTFKRYRYTPLSEVVASPAVEVLGGTWISGSELAYPTYATTSTIYGHVNFTYTLADNSPPVAVATSNQTTGEAPLGILFDAGGSSDADGTILSYHWDFGDGSVGSGEQASHTYQNAGTFIAKLTVADNDGGQSSDEITVSVTQPVVPKRAYEGTRQQAGYSQSYVLGTQFSLSRSIRITKIIVDGLLNGTSNNVGLYRDGQTTPLVTYSITTGLATGEQSIAVDLILQPGTYRLAGAFKKYRYTPATELTTAPGITVLGGTYLSGTALTYPTYRYSAYIYGHVNFEFVNLE